MFNRYGMYEENDGVWMLPDDRGEYVLHDDIKELVKLCRIYFFETDATANRDGAKERIREILKESEEAP